MLRIRKFRSRQDWEKNRLGTIGGSDASAALGLNPWKTNVQLWEEMTGRAILKDISDSPAIQYGSAAEQYIRELFALDFPEYAVQYEQNAYWTNDMYPWAHASVDGLLRDLDGELGVLEIKTTTIQNGMQLQRYNDGILPVQYYVQVLYYMAVLEAEFAIVTVQMKFPKSAPELMKKETRHFRINRCDVEDDIEFVMDSIEKFMEYVKADKMPPLALPEV